MVDEMEEYIIRMIERKFHIRSMANKLNVDRRISVKRGS
jgi:hypothetical protein